jgi:hypothetical protein
LEEGYQEILTGLDCKPYPSLEGMKNIQPLAKLREPRLANINLESIVDESLMRRLDSVASSIESIEATESSEGKSGFRSLPLGSL